MNDCEICGGSGKIRLPVRERLSAWNPDYSIHMSKIREYPCPECGSGIPQENIKIIQAENYVSGCIREVGYILHCKRAMAHQMGQILFDEEQITFTKDTKNLDINKRSLLSSPEKYMFGDYLLRGKLGVVSPRFVAKFEERVQEHQEGVARVVVEEATRAIRNWDSLCKNPIIQKEIAIRFLYEALDKIAKK